MYMTGFHLSGIGVRRCLSLQEKTVDLLAIQSRRRGLSMKAVTNRDMSNHNTKAGVSNKTKVSSDTS